ncbi:ATP-binding protein [Streptomyces nigrescens]|uniref:ATP-binding protein n=1 Tax=Streptomyces nigrescens TaxID=1920 RepID=UPI0021C3DF39|nr:ATP-binding protein [Streptomyces nigrescens]
MKSNPVGDTRTAQLSHPSHHFEMRFSSTPRGARLARRLCAERLHAWGVPYATEGHDVLALIVAELAANAVRHGRLPGRDFLLRLTAHAATVRVEVTDIRGERLPEPVAGPPALDRTGGRGLLLVECLADRWGWFPRACGAPGKTVWAEYDRPRANVVRGVSQP